jgi:hypothetical protein
MAALRLEDIQKPVDVEGNPVEVGKNYLIKMNLKAEHNRHLENDVEFVNAIEFGQKIRTMRGTQTLHGVFNVQKINNIRDRNCYDVFCTFIGNMSNQEDVFEPVTVHEPKVYLFNIEDYTFEHVPDEKLRLSFDVQPPNNPVVVQKPYERAENPDEGGRSNKRKSKKRKSKKRKYKNKIVRF